MDLPGRVSIPELMGNDVPEEGARVKRTSDSGSEIQSVIPETWPKPTSVNFFIYKLKGLC